MKLTFDYYHNLEQVDLFLCNPDGRELFPLPGKSRNLTLRFNDLSELTFEVDSKITLSNNTVVDLEAYDYIQTKRLVYATNIGWFQISGVDEHDNGVVTYKTVKAESYQSVLKNKGFISEERVYCFYNPNDPHDDRYDSTKEDSIPSVLGQWSKQLGIKQALGQGLSEPTTPYDDWTVTYIHASLIYAGTGSKCRTFKESATYGYDWMVNDVEEAFEVVILFDFMYKTIHVMTPNEVAQRVNVIYTFNNFMKNVDINEASDDIVTVLNCNGDNCDITAVNPTGTNYICDFSYYMDKTNYRWMSSALIAKLEQWKADCAAEKDTYEGYIENIRTLYQSATEKETLLQEMSLSLADLRTAQNKRTVLGSGKPGSLCGIVTAESVKSYRTTKNGVETVVGGRSIMPGTDYHSTDFTGAETITAYQYSPKYDDETRQWDWSQAGEAKTGTADEIVAFNLSDDNTSGVSYWYFSDVNDNSSYCKLQSAVTVNKDSATSTNYCGGFDRYIAYTYPSYVGTLPRKADLSVDDTTTLTLEDLLNDVHNTSMSWGDIKAKYSISDDAGGTTVYTDKVSVWINLREQRVKELNIDLYGYGFTPSGYQCDYKKTVDTKDGFIYVTTGSGGKLLPTDDSLYGRINTLQSQISSIASRLNILSYFADTPTLLRELNCYWIEGDYTNDNIAVLEETTPEEEIDLANELLDAGYIELSKVCQPRFSFSIESIDATKQYEFKDQMRLLELGKIITIEKDEGLWYYPALLEISMNLDNSEEFSMTFANAMRLDDWGYTYADLISDASSTSRKVSANWQDILAYSKERAEISSLIKDPLDTTLRASFANMVNQEFTVDKNGILGRKKVSKTSDEFEDEQVRLINNLLIFTDDNWKTAKTALGKIAYQAMDEYGNLVYESDGVTPKMVTSYGLIAETIIGQLIIGERLCIRNQGRTITIGADGITIKTKVENEEGQDEEVIVFRAASDGTLIVRNYATAESVASAIELAENGIKAYVKSDGGSTDSFGWSLTSDGFYLYSGSTSPVMAVTSKKAVFAGELSAAVGTFKGSLSAATGTFAGELKAATGTFEGELKAATGSFTGTVTADQGKIGGWNITGEALYKDYVEEGNKYHIGLHAALYHGEDGSLTGKAAIDNSTVFEVDVNGYPILYFRPNGLLHAEKAEISGEIAGELQDGIKIGTNGICTLSAYNYGHGIAGCTLKYSDNGYLSIGGGSGGSEVTMRTSGYLTLVTDTQAGSIVLKGKNLTLGNADAGSDKLETSQGLLYGSWTWKDSSAALTSDARLKTDIAEIDERYDVFYDNLKPSVFRYKTGTSHRLHTGFIAQEVLSALNTAKISTADFAGYVAQESQDGITYCLRYEEFIALNTAQIQKLKNRVAKIEETLAKLQEG